MARAAEESPATSEAFSSALRKWPLAERCFHRDMRGAKSASSRASSAVPLQLQATLQGGGPLPANVHKNQSLRTGWPACRWEIQMSVRSATSRLNLPTALSFKFAIVPPTYMTFPSSTARTGRVKIKSRHKAVTVRVMVLSSRGRGAKTGRFRAMHWRCRRMGWQVTSFVRCIKESAGHCRHCKASPSTAGRLCWVLVH